MTTIGKLLMHATFFYKNFAEITVVPLSNLDPMHTFI